MLAGLDTCPSSISKSKELDLSKICFSSCFLILLSNFYRYILDRFPKQQLGSPALVDAVGYMAEQVRTFPCLQVICFGALIIAVSWPCVAAGELTITARARIPAGSFVPAMRSSKMVTSSRPRPDNYS